MSVFHGAGLSYIPAPKLKLPGHEESYNPPKEYLPTEVCSGNMHVLLLPK